MPVSRIVAVGASSGGIDALRRLLAAVPAAFPAPIVIVVHISANSPGILDQILNRTAAVPVVLPRGGERLRGGHAYIAPPDVHLIVEPGTLRLTRGPRENRFRPAIDPLFRSVAQVYGPAAIGVVLTGNLNDGTAGLQAIKQLGGTAVVQDPADAMYPSMPQNALRHVPIDYSVPLGEMAALLTRLVSADVYEPSTPGVSGPVDIELRIAKEENPLQAGLAGLGTPSVLHLSRVPRRPARDRRAAAAALSLSYGPRVLGRSTRGFAQRIG